MNWFCEKADVCSKIREIIASEIMLLIHFDEKIALLCIVFKMRKAQCTVEIMAKISWNQLFY